MKKREFILRTQAQGHIDEHGVPDDTVFKETGPADKEAEYAAIAEAFCQTGAVPPSPGN